ncbi:uncharacterized protein Hap1MRO34_012229 [Clarias gariepinus]
MAFLKYSFTLAFLNGLAMSFIIEPNCKELTEPLELDGNYSSIMGKWILAVGASEGIVGMIVQTMDTHWLELSLGANDDTLFMKQAFRIDNRCRFESNDIPHKNNSGHGSDDGENIQYGLLPSCSTCLTAYFSQQYGEYPTRTLFLFSREREVSTSAVDLFKKQAECLKFPKPYTFYSTTSELCQEGSNETGAEQN